MEKMKQDKRNIFFIFPIIVAIILLVLFFPFRKIPDGVPSDYYDRIDVLNDNDVDLYLYSDEIDFNGDYDYKKVYNFTDLGNPMGSHINVLVIDMKKNIQKELATEEQIARLYETYFFTIMFVNYESSGSSQYSTFIDDIDQDSDMIIFSYDSSGNGYSGSDSGGFPSNQFLMYAILDNIGYIVEENKK